MELASVPLRLSLGLLCACPCPCPCQYGLCSIRSESKDAEDSIPWASNPRSNLCLCVFSGSVAILAQAIADNTGHHNSPRPEEFRVMSLLVGDASFPMGSRRQRRADRKAAMTAPSEPHEVVAPPPAKAAADGLSAHPANASFVPRRVVATRPATNSLANASSSSLVAGATTLPAKSPYPATAFAILRPFVVLPIAADGISPHPATATADEPPWKITRLESSLMTQAMPPAATAATAAIAAAAACAPGTQAHTAATAAATAAIIAAAREQDSLVQPWTLERRARLAMREETGQFFWF